MVSMLIMTCNTKCCIQLWTSRALLCFPYCGFCSCVPFSPYHCPWRGGILGFASTIPPGSWCVTATTHSLHYVPFHHLWNQFHLSSCVATEKCAHHPGSSLILTFLCSFYLLEMLVLILALVCVVFVSELLMPVPCGIRLLLYLTLLPARALTF